MYLTIRFDIIASMPRNAELLSSNFIIREFPSESEILAFAEKRPDVARLIALGFGHDINTINPHKLVEDQYAHGTGRTSVFIAEGDGKAIGSLDLILWKNDSLDKRGGPLRDYLYTVGHEFLDMEAVREQQILACDVGVVVHPDYRGLSIARSLYQCALLSINPVIFFGQTKTAGAPVSRQRALGDAYITYYGGLPIDETEHAPADLGGFLTDAYYHARADRAVRTSDESGVHYDPGSDVLGHEIDVDLDKLPPNVKTVFKQIKETGRDRPAGHTTFAVLASVNKKFLL